MIHPQAFSTRQKIQYHHVDGEGRLKSSAALEVLEEAAMDDSYARGVDVFSLLREGYGWVVRGGSIEFLRYPSYGETVTVETWLSQWTAFQGHREFVVYNASEEPCVRATTLWAFLDVRTRRPVPGTFFQEATLGEALEAQVETVDNDQLLHNVVRRREP